MGKAPKRPANANRQAFFRDRRIRTLQSDWTYPLRGVCPQVSAFCAARHGRTYADILCIGPRTYADICGHRSFWMFQNKDIVHVPFTSRSRPKKGHFGHANVHHVPILFTVLGCAWLRPNPPHVFICPHMSGAPRPLAYGWIRRSIMPCHVCLTAAGKPPSIAAIAASHAASRSHGELVGPCDRAGGRGYRPSIPTGGCLYKHRPPVQMGLQKQIIPKTEH